MADKESRRFGLTLNELIVLQRERGLGDVHVIATDADAFHLAHTDAERAAGENTEECRFHQRLGEYAEAPVEPGVYVVVERPPFAYSESYPVELFDFCPVVVIGEADA